MGAFIWSGITHPRAVMGPGDAPLMLALAILIALFTWLFMASPGRWIMRRSRLAAFVSGTVFVPVSIVAIDLLMVATAPKGGGPNDGLGIAFAGLIVLALYAMPVGLVTSAVYVWRRRAGNAG